METFTQVAHGLGFLGAVVLLLWLQVVARPILVKCLARLEESTSYARYCAALMRAGALRFAMPLDGIPDPLTEADAEKKAEAEVIDLGPELAKAAQLARVVGSGPQKPA